MFSNLLPHVVYFVKDFSLYITLIIISVVSMILFSYKIFKSKLTEKKKKITLILIFTAFLIVLFYSVFEAYFRFIYDEPDGLGFLKVNKRWQDRHVIFNNYQFRDRDFISEKKEGTIRIGVLGDSITYGGGIENKKDRFSDILEKKLRESNFNVEVYNLGKSGYDTEGEISVYSSVKHLNFDIIVWEYFLNDIQALEKSTGTTIINQNRKRAQIIEAISQKSYFFDFLYWRLSSKYQKTIQQLRFADFDKYEDLNRLKKHREQIVQFIKSLEMENKKIVVIIFPSVYFIGPNYPAGDIHQMINKIFKSQGVETIDLLDYLKNYQAKELVSSKFDTHPNETVHYLAAQLLFEKVSSYLKDNQKL